MKGRIKTKYPGVFYREAERIGGEGKEKVFYIVFKKDGKVLEEKVGRQFADDMTPAKAASIRSQRIEGKRVSPKEKRRVEKERKIAEDSRPTMTRLWDEYKRQRPVDKSLRTDDGRFHLHLAPYFGGKTPAEIISLDVDRIRVRMLKTHAPQTVKHVVALLKRIIRFGVKKGLCPEINTGRLHIEMPRVDNKVTEDLDGEQLARLIRSIEDDPNRKAADIMLVALFTGMRKGEILNLKWEDVSFDREVIYIRDPKCGTDQSIPMNQEARNIFVRQVRTDSPYVFPGKNGGRLQYIQPPIQRIRARAKLPKGFRPLHGLRHVYASMLASSGQVDMYTLQKLLTHKSATMTQRYAHLRDEALKRGSDVAGALFGEIMGNGNGGRKVVGIKRGEE